MLPLAGFGTQGRGDAVHVFCRAAFKIFFLSLVVASLSVIGATAQERSLIVAATTSVEDSGLFKFLLPKFTARSGMTVRVVSRASAQALMTAVTGLVDVVIVNDPRAVDRFIGSGDGIRRHTMMSNDFVIVGPSSDPAQIKGSKDAAGALRMLARKRAPFVSRGDESGTHQAEMRLWEAAGVNPKTRSGNWYRESTLGMGLTVAMAARLKAYVFTDRATWLAASDTQGLEILVEGDPMLFNQYEIIQVNPVKHSHVDVAGATAFIDWIVSEEGQGLIASYKMDGRQSFFPNAEGQN